MKELIIAIATLFLTGITILAHKYPHAYEKLSLPLSIFNIGFTIIFMVVGFFIGINKAHTALLQFIPSDKQSAALTVMESIKLPSHYLVIGLAIWLGLWFYSIFLTLLPSLLKKES